MSANDDFFGGMKSEQDRNKEWTDAAQFFVRLRQGPEEEIHPEPEQVKEAGIKDYARAAWEMGKASDPTGIAHAATASKGGLAAVLGGAALGGGASLLLNRGKKELGGESQLEHERMKEKDFRATQPEPKTFLGKAKGHLQDLGAGMASASRKHPLVAGAVGAIGGAAAASKIHRALVGRLK